MPGSARGGRGVKHAATKREFLNHCCYLAATTPLFVLNKKTMIVIKAVVTWSRLTPSAH